VKLVEDGKLDLDALVRSCIAELSIIPWRGILWKEDGSIGWMRFGRIHKKQV
jgi:hypothetical protein